MSIKLHDAVTLKNDMLEHGLRTGMVGAVVEIFTSPALAYEIEFVGKDGRPIAIKTFSADQITKV